MACLKMVLVAGTTIKRSPFATLRPFKIFAAASISSIDMNGASYYLDYDMELNSFAVEYYPNGRPSRFSANVRLGNENVLLEVNHPYSYRLGEDVYLTGYDITKGNESNYCILQVVKQPWKYVMVAGILMMLAGAVLLFINGAKAYDKLG